MKDTQRIRQNAIWETCQKLRKDKEPLTRVHFRFWMGSVIALFPDDKEHSTDPNIVGSYMHVGQHGPAHYKGIMGKSRKATPMEYENLKKELTGIGYNLEIL